MRTERRFKVFDSHGNIQLKKVYTNRKAAWQLTWGLPGVSRRLTQYHANRILNAVFIDTTERSHVSIFVMPDTIVLQTTCLRIGSNYVLTQSKADAISSLIRSMVYSAEDTRGSQDTTGQDMTGPNMTGPNMIGPDTTEQDMTGPDSEWSLDDFMKSVGVVWSSYTITQ